MAGLGKNCTWVGENRGGLSVLPTRCQLLQLRLRWCLRCQRPLRKSFHLRRRTYGRDADDVAWVLGTPAPLIPSLRSDCSMAIRPLPHHYTWNTPTPCCWCSSITTDLLLPRMATTSYSTRGTLNVAALPPGTGNSGNSRRLQERHLFLGYRLSSGSTGIDKTVFVGLMDYNSNIYDRNIDKSNSTGRFSQ